MLTPTRSIVTINALISQAERWERTDRIAEELRTMNPDVVLLQEVTSEVFDGTSDILNRMAERSGMAVASYEVFKEWDVLPQNSTPYGGGTFSPFRSGVGILTTLPVVESGRAYTTDPNPDVSGHGCYAVLEDGPNILIVFSLHGAWGGDRPQNRENQFIHAVHQASYLEKKYASRNPVVVLGGDFNAEPDSAVLRYLTGQQSLNGNGTFWIDAWDYLGEGPGWTFDPSSYWAKSTAHYVGIEHPEFMPMRRLDYLLVKGWVYGRRGQPASVSLCFNDEDERGATVSDHFGVQATLWMPEKWPLGPQKAYTRATSRK